MAVSKKKTKTAAKPAKELNNAAIVLITIFCCLIGFLIGWVIGAII